MNLRPFPTCKILAFDWAKAPLGAIGDWPPSLKTVVSLMLNSPQPMWIGWGEQATFLYNDASRRKPMWRKPTAGCSRPIDPTPSFSTSA